MNEFEIKEKNGAGDFKMSRRPEEREETDGFEIKEKYGVEDFKRLIRRLRAPGGCPWDAAQTHGSIRDNVIEEACEVAEAIDKDDAEALREELGDLLMQVIFHCAMEEEKGGFDLDDVADAACRKLVFRHPHVFGGDGAERAGDADALGLWEEAKRREKGIKCASEAMASVAGTLPALWRARKIQKKMPPESAGGAELACSLIEGDAGRLRARLEQCPELIEDALGRLLFDCVMLSLACGVDPERALHRACDRRIEAERTAERGRAGERPAVG